MCVLYYMQLLTVLTCIFGFICERASLQQQQHSIFSQASWGRLEMKPRKSLSVATTRIENCDSIVSIFLSL